MPEVHAKLSASGAHRWLNCPGSIVLEEGFEDSGSDYAREGTLAHSVAELKLQKYFVKGIGPKTFSKAMGAFKEDPSWAPEMDKYTDVYFDEIKRRALTYPSSPYVSIEERVDFSAWVPEGFGTCDCIMIYGDTLQVADLKYGKGVPVSPEENPQLMLYGLGAYRAYSLLYKIDRVVLTIIQPRLDSILDWEISAKDLLAWGDSIKDRAKEAFEGSETLAQGDHCRFCRAKSRCPERAKVMFAKVEELKPHMAQDLALVSNQDLSRYMLEAKGLVDWIKDLEEEALATILAGEEVPGFKAVEGRSVRKFKDQDQAFGLLEAQGFDEAILYERKPLSLSKLEKIVGKKDFADILGDQIVKPQGKPTLVEESDKRKPYVKDLGFEEI